MKFKVLGSGSKGNMIYVETPQTKILIDSGISYANAKNFLSEDGIDVSDIKAIFCTHEHSDHVKELKMMMKKTNALLFINQLSFNNLKSQTRECIDVDRVKHIDANKIYTFHDLTIYTLQLSHDSSNCLGFVFKCGEKMLLYATDTGLINVNYFPIIKKCNSLIIEANHNVEMLQESHRPVELKRRILSVKGHMSNQITYTVLDNVLSDKVNHVVLAHVSEDCNSDEAIYDEVINRLVDRFSCSFYIARQRETLELLEV